MKQEHDAAYFRRREATARDLADRSNDPQIKRIHLQMAEDYAKRAEEAAAQPV